MSMQQKWTCKRARLLYVCRCSMCDELHRVHHVMCVMSQIRALCDIKHLVQWQLQWQLPCAQHTTYSRSSIPSTDSNQSTMQYSTDHADRGEAIVSPAVNSTFRGSSHTFRGSSHTFRGSSHTFRGSSHTFRGSSHTFRGSSKMPSSASVSRT